MSCGLEKLVTLRIGKRTFRVKACIASGTDRTVVSSEAARRLGIGSKGATARVALSSGGCARRERVEINDEVAAGYDSHLVVGNDFLSDTGALIIAKPGESEVLCGRRREAALRDEEPGIKDRHFQRQGVVREARQEGGSR